MIGELRSRSAEIQKAFADTWTMDSRDIDRPAPETILKKLIYESVPTLIPRLEEEFFGAGPLQTLLDDERVSEIVVNGPDDIWVEIEGLFTRWNDSFLDAASFKNFVDRLAADCQIQLDLTRPFADGRWRDFRLHFVLAPLSDCSFHLTFRRLSRVPWTFDRLLTAGWALPRQIERLRTLISERKNILFIGGTGSGKTSALGASLLELPGTERVVVLEDTSELPKPNGASTKLLTRPAVPPLLGEVSLGDLVKQSLRMRPSRLAIGEVRGGEAKDLLMALSTGHSGSFGTLHAADPRQALIRLEMLVQMGAPQWPPEAIRQLIKLGLDAICVCGIENGHRRLLGLYMVAALETFGFILEPIA